MPHITSEQRYAISCMKAAGKMQNEIAQMIGRSPSVISRELARNCDKRSGQYHDELAQRKAKERQVNKKRTGRFTPAVQAYVESKLALRYSPEQLVGVSKKEEVDCVCVERIYQHIWKDKNSGGKLCEYLRTRGKRYRKRGNKKDRRGCIPNRVDISQRPAIVEKRSRIGDLEIDTIIGKDHKGAIVTINDRATGLLKMKKVAMKEAQLVADAAIEKLLPWKDIIHTITSDNGKEFALHQTIGTALDVDFFFAKPYHSWQRGSNENLNGLIRQYIPKGSDFNLLTDEYIQYVEDELNNRPRKRFNFESPNKIFNQKVAFET
jgi:transposase, IS30 family